MKRPAKVLTVITLVIAGAVGYIEYPLIKGAAAATWDQWHGRRTLYQLGCEIGPSQPRDPLNFRFEELLHQRYALYFETTGGFAPTDTTMKYVEGYNSVSFCMMGRTFNPQFLKRTYDEAKRDVVVRGTALRGCVSHEHLELPTGEHVVLWAGAGLSEAELFRERSFPVVVTGELTEVRAGQWNKTFGRRLRAVSIANDSSGHCGPG